MATAKPTSLSTEVLTKLCMPIPPSITTIGGSSCPALIFPGEGSAVLMVRQPRMPCYKLAAKFQREDMIERFLRSARSGFYFSVEQEGEVAAGDSLKFLSRDSTGITIAEMNRLFLNDKYDHDLLQKAMNTSALPDDWREYFAPRLERPAAKA